MAIWSSTTHLLAFRAMGKVAKRSPVTKGEKTKVTVIYAALRQEIMNGSLAPGSKLKTRKLSERFSVGLSPIREALSRLSSDGWAIQSDRRGFSVAPMSLEELRDLSLARMMVFETALRASIANGDADWEDRVRQASAYLAGLGAPQNLEGPEAEQWHRAHRTYHMVLHDSCGSQRLRGFCAQLFDEFERYRHLGKTHIARTISVVDQHNAITEAVLARDADRAAALLVDHFKGAAAVLENALPS